MLNELTKRICIALAAFSAIAIPQTAAQEAKGGSLLVRTNDGRKHFILSADAHWPLNVKERFDASALLFHNGNLLTINDRNGVVYEITLGEDAAEAKRTDLFSKSALTNAAASRTARFDCEGLGTDASGNLYLSEESQRLIFKSPADGTSVEALKIDWSPVRKYFTGGVNASFEGIAILGNRIFVANERTTARIIEVDLSTLEVTTSFFVDSDTFAFGGPHYSDLAVADGRLFILNRNHRCIFEIEPDNKRVLAEYRFGQMEVAEEVAYFSDYPTGAMEGLAIDDDYFWMITDNNGKGRIKNSSDFRPTLFRCKRPQRD